MATPRVRSQIEMPLRSTSGVNNINTTEVRRLAVALPAMSEQREIVRRTSEILTSVEGLITRIDGIERQIQRSSRAVLAKALQGEFAMNR